MFQLFVVFRETHRVTLDTQAFVAFDAVEDRFLFVARHLTPMCLSRGLTFMLNCTGKAIGYDLGRCPMPTTTGGRTPVVLVQGFVSHKHIIVSANFSLNTD